MLPNYIIRVILRIVLFNYSIEGRKQWAIYYTFLCSLHYRTITRGTVVSAFLMVRPVLKFTSLVVEINYIDGIQMVR